MKLKALLLICFLILPMAAGLIMAEPGAFEDAGGSRAGQTHFLKAAAEIPAPPRSAQSGEGNPEEGILWKLLGVFIVGIGLNLTPCVYPLIPVTISYFGGKSAAASGGSQASGMAFHASLYVLGLAVMNSMLGVFAALSGRLLGAVLQNPMTIIMIAAVLTLFALSMFGVWEFRVPGALTGIAARNYAGYFGSLFIGLTVGLIAAPCIGPFVAGLLVWVAGTGNPWFGFLVFFTLSLGMGLPLFVLALMSGRIQRLPRSGEWMVWVRKLMGWILIGMAAFFLRSLLGDLWGTVLLGATAVAAGLHLGWLDSSTAGFRAFAWIKKATGVICLAITAMLLWSQVSEGKGVEWLGYSEHVMADAKRTGKPIILDFSAEWCIPCRQMEKHTFHDPAVVEAAEKYFIMIKVDLTHGTDEATGRLVRLYNIRGVPTVIFLKPGGEEARDLRVMEFMDSERFLARMMELAGPGEGPRGR